MRRKFRLNAKNFMNFFSTSSFLLFFIVSSLCARERITLLDVDIVVRKDASILVRESITVFCERKEIIRGIVRDIPTRYSGFLGTVYEAPIMVQSITMDGNTIPYVINNAVDGIIMTIKDDQKLLPIGLHTFVIEYIVNWQIAFFDETAENFWASVPGISLLKNLGNRYHSGQATADSFEESHEELYWNAVGTGCRFIVERARVRVILPIGISSNSIRVAGYRGEYEERDILGFNATVDAQGVAHFETTYSLPPRNGFTIVVGWPPGFIEKPSWWSCFAHFVHDNPFFSFYVVFTFGAYSIGNYCSC